MTGIYIDKKIRPGVVFLYGFIVSIIGNLPAFFKSQYASMEDWGYFNALSLFVRSCILHYKTIFMYDPWSCGGVDILRNPENRIFSPMVLLDIIFPPQIANILSLVIYGAVGFLGCYYLLKHLKISFITSVICSTLFINAHWFGLHYAAGHIPYGSFLLLPWIFLAILNIHERKHMFLFISLCTLFLLDGGFYPFIFSLVLLICGFLFGLIDYKKIFNRIFWKENWWFIGLLSLCFFLIISIKLEPLLTIERIVWSEEYKSLPLSNFLFLFFNPLGTPMNEMPPDQFHEYKYHEYGCYIGIVIVIILVHYLFNREHIKKSMKYLIPAAFFFWIAVGWGIFFNPWAIIQKIPFINAAHIQARYFLLMYFFLILILAFALQRLQMKHFKWYYLLVAFLLIESFFVRMYPMFKVYEQGDLNKLQPFTTSILKNNMLTQTVNTGEKPYHYLTSYGHTIVYERLLPPSGVIAAGAQGYMGEIYIDDPKVSGNVRYTEVIPGKITFLYHIDNPAQLPTVIRMNLNYKSGWKVIAGDNAQIHNPDFLDLIMVKVGNQDGTVTIQYNPPNLALVLVIYSIGILMWICILLSFIFKERIRTVLKLKTKTGL